VKVFVVYDTKYGNTKLAAETIVEGMREVEGIETAMSDVEEIDLEKVTDYDAILIGSPNHWGDLSAVSKGLSTNLANLN
jgi:menaquinone-dependent protoporphyrinogen IX oxidase